MPVNTTLPRLVIQLVFFFRRSNQALKGKQSTENYVTYAAVLGRVEFAICFDGLACPDDDQ